MLNVIILAAGQGTRMRSALPKVLHPLGGQPLLAYVIEESLKLTPRTCSVVAPSHFPQEKFTQFPVQWVVQDPPRGTGDAVRCVLEKIPLQGDVLILCGDAPLIQSATLTHLFNAYTQQPRPSLLCVGMRVNTPNQYGRILADENQRVTKIIELKDATAQEQSSNLCNSGLLLGPVDILQQLVQQLQPINQSQEYYLTDCVALAQTQGIPTYVIEAPVEEFCGINTRAELAAAETILQNRWRSHWLTHGVTLIDPPSVFFSKDTYLEPDVTIGPYVTFGNEVQIRRNARILSFCHIERSEIGEGATIGPFAHLRGGNVMERNTTVGNFVELKKTTLREGAKVKHLSYLGDATVGLETNVGAGTITCNYDGLHKHATVIGNYVSIGAHTSLIAPLTIGDHATIGAGSTIVEGVPAQALAIARERQVTKAGWVKSIRQKAQGD